MFKVSAILALATGLLMLGTAAAQDVPLECELWGINCPSDGGGDTGGDTDEGDTGGDTGEGGTDEEPSGDDTSGDDPVPAEDPCGVVAAKTLPSGASAQGVANSAKGLQTASQASASGRSSAQCRAGQG